jgi:hypothetical protein
MAGTGVNLEHLIGVALNDVHKYTDHARTAQTKAKFKAAIAFQHAGRKPGGHPRTPSKVHLRVPCADVIF